MKLIMRYGEPKEVDTSFIFNNQYNTTDGKRVYDRDVIRIEDDIRLTDFYVCSVAQGSYEHCVEAIKNERAKIKDCQNCWKYHRRKIDENKIVKTEGNKEIVTIESTYEYYCSADGKCKHDIEETPKLYRDSMNCFFVKYPNGVPDIKPFIDFLIANKEKYGIVPYWDDMTNLDNGDRFTYKSRKAFGSYIFEGRNDMGYLELSNNNNRFHFIIDFENKKFITINSIDYKVCDKLTEYKWVNNKSVEKPITNFDKFEKWFWPIVDDFLATK